MISKKKEIEYIKNLSKLFLEKKEIDIFQKELDEIIIFMKKLNELDTKNIDITIYPTDIKNVFRKDIIKDSISINNALLNAPYVDGNYFKINKIL